MESIKNDIESKLCTLEIDRKSNKKLKGVNPILKLFYLNEWLVSELELMGYTSAKNIQKHRKVYETPEGNRTETSSRVVC